MHTVLNELTIMSGFSRLVDSLPVAVFQRVFIVTNPSHCFRVGDFLARVALLDFLLDGLYGPLP